MEDQSADRHRRGLMRADHRQSRAKMRHGSNKQAIILSFAMGPNVAGVITTAIIAGIYVGLLR